MGLVFGLGGGAGLVIGRWADRPPYASASQRDGFRRCCGPNGLAVDAKPLIPLLHQLCKGAGLRISREPAGHVASAQPREPEAERSTGSGALKVRQSGSSGLTSRPRRSAGPDCRLRWQSRERRITAMTAAVWNGSRVRHHLCVGAGTAEIRPDPRAARCDLRCSRTAHPGRGRRLWPGLQTRSGSALARRSKPIRLATSAGICASGIMFGPSEGARSGSSCVSMNTPAIPSATAARAMTGANSR